MNTEKSEEHTKAPITEKKLGELYRHCMMKGWRFIPPKSWKTAKVG